MWRWIPANKQYTVWHLAWSTFKVSWAFCLNGGNYFHALVFLSLKNRKNVWNCFALFSRIRKWVQRVVNRFSSNLTRVSPHNVAKKPCPHFSVAHKFLKNRSCRMRPPVWLRQHFQSGQGFCMNATYTGQEKGENAKGGTPIYKLYRYVPLWRVRFLSSLV